MTRCWRCRIRSAACWPPRSSTPSSRSAGSRVWLIKVNQQPYRVPGSDPNSLVISVDAIPRDIDPIPFVAGEQLYAVDSGGVGQAGEHDERFADYECRSPDR